MRAIVERPRLHEQLEVPTVAERNGDLSGFNTAGQAPLAPVRQHQPDR